MFLGVLLWGVYFMNFRDFFRILVSRRRSLSYQERVKNIMFRYYVFNSLSFIFLIVGACVLVFYYGFSKLMFLCALITFGIIFLIISDTYNEDICNKCGFGEYLNKMDKLISVVYIIYVLLFIFIIVMMKLNYGR